MEARLQKARDAGLTGRLMTPEVQRALARRTGVRVDDLSAEQRAAMDPTRLFNPEQHKRRNQLRAAARARGVDFQDLVSPDLQGIVRRYLGRTDYDQMWRELRAEVFASTAEHEIGHTLGLRHNFQGSYDSLNYFDSYWDLRSETLKRSETVADLYEQAQLTEAQHAGFMRQQQYSSIMDYGYSWQNDIMGLGKYDVAALIFGYTAGSYRAEGTRCGSCCVRAGSGCIAKLPGLIEVFSRSKAALGEAGDLLTRQELGFTYDDPGLPSVNLLERYDYSTVATAFPSLDDLKDRKLMNYADFLEAKAAGGDARSASRTCSAPMSGRAAW
ncbi:MAG: zinc-dependent metalloprotease [bacterium]